MRLTLQKVRRNAAVNYSSSKYRMPLSLEEKRYELQSCHLIGGNIVLERQFVLRRMKNFAFRFTAIKRCFTRKRTSGIGSAVVSEFVPFI
uniref:Uncharacterized protein n=1 Tax=Ascaris lumbricoides TaxID=6252 RepID=A0A0M3HQA7_ASCLU